jgi:hypothetical protein
MGNKIKINQYFTYRAQRNKIYPTILPAQKTCVLNTSIL